MPFRLLERIMFSPSRRLRTPAMIFSVLAMSACATTSVPASSRDRAASTAVALESAAPDSVPAQVRRRGMPLTRADVERAVRRGLGVFLSHVQVSPVLEAGRFVGFRLERADDLEDWRASGSDIRVGDVVRRVNGMSIERPEQALWAFNNLRTVPALELLVRRDGADVTIRQPIVDAPPGS